MIMSIFRDLQMDTISPSVLGFVQFVRRMYGKKNLTGETLLITAVYRWGQGVALSGKKIN
jgi:hypothetical protein